MSERVSGGWAEDQLRFFATSSNETVTMAKEVFARVLRDLLDARKALENSEMNEHDINEVCQRLERERDEAAKFIAWVHRECAIDGNNLDGGAAQEKLVELGFAEMRAPDAGSFEEEEWGADCLLCYLKPEWAARAAAKDEGSGALHIGTPFETDHGGEGSAGAAG